MSNNIAASNNNVIKIEEEEDLKRLQHTDKKEKLLKLYRSFFKFLRMQIDTDSTDEDDRSIDFEYIYIDDDILCEEKAVEIVKEIEELEKELERLG